jgi:hypothetical protein
MKAIGLRFARKAVNDTSRNTSRINGIIELCKMQPADVIYRPGFAFAFGL